MNRKALIILLLLLTVCFCLPFIQKNGVIHIKKVEVENKSVVGVRQVIEVEVLESEYDVAIENMGKEMDEIDSIDNKKEWFIAYKDIIGKYSYIIDSPETLFDCFTEEELDLLFRVVQAEIGDEYSFEQKVNVANVIFNRLEHDRFPDTLFEILTLDQFSVISNGRCINIEVSEETILACEYAFMMEDTTGGSLFFDSNNKLKYKFVKNDGAHNFYTLK